jgi:hypothetical protein
MWALRATLGSLPTGYTVPVLTIYRWLIIPSVELVVSVVVGLLGPLVGWFIRGMVVVVWRGCLSLALFVAAVRWSDVALTCGVVATVFFVQH